MATQEENPMMTPEYLRVEHLLTLFAQAQYLQDQAVKKATEAGIGKVMLRSQKAQLGELWKSEYASLVMANHAFYPGNDVQGVDGPIKYAYMLSARKQPRAQQKKPDLFKKAMDRTLDRVLAKHPRYFGIVTGSFTAASGNTVPLKTAIKDRLEMALSEITKGVAISSTLEIKAEPYVPLVFQPLAERGVIPSAPGFLGVRPLVPPPPPPLQFAVPLSQQIPVETIEPTEGAAPAPVEVPIEQMVEAAVRIGARPEVEPESGQPLAKRRKVEVISPPPTTPGPPMVPQPTVPVTQPLPQDVPPGAPPQGGQTVYDYLPNLFNSTDDDDDDDYDFPLY